MISIIIDIKVFSSKEGKAFKMAYLSTGKTIFLSEDSPLKIGDTVVTTVFTYKRKDGTVGTTLVATKVTLG